MSVLLHHPALVLVIPTDAMTGPPDSGFDPEDYDDTELTQLPTQWAELVVEALAAVGEVSPR
jgi:hypothetical protein